MLYTCVARSRPTKSGAKLQKKFDIRKENVEKSKNIFKFSQKEGFGHGNTTSIAEYLRSAIPHIFLLFQVDLFPHSSFVHYPECHSGHFSPCSRARIVSSESSDLSSFSGGSVPPLYLRPLSRNFIPAFLSLSFFVHFGSFWTNRSPPRTKKR